MGNFLSGMVLGFREGLEAFLILVILLRFLRRTARADLAKSVWAGAGIGIFASLLIGGALYAVSGAMGRMEQTAKLWESGSSLIALLFITTFIVWMIRQGSGMAGTVERDAADHLSGGGILLISALMVAREGVEISLFSFAGEYALAAIFAGVGAALVLTALIYGSLVRIDLKTIFTITLFYLILQAGFLLGYGIHEGLSALKEIGVLAESSPLFLRAFNLSGTPLDHKTGFLGLPLYVLAGWYSRPEILQFAAQYLYTGGLLYFWRRTQKAAVFR
jgi:high-affinity iron transporter